MCFHIDIFLPVEISSVRCAGHLLETPSALPPYAQVKEQRAESPPPRRALSRELALVCCLLLERLASLIKARLRFTNKKVFCFVIVASCILLLVYLLKICLLRLFHAS